MKKKALLNNVPLMMNETVSFEVFEMRIAETHLKQKPPEPQPF